MKQIALSIEQMGYLKELGIDTSDASLIWLVNGGKLLLCTRDLEDRFNEYGKIYPAYTFPDIWEKLPSAIRILGTSYYKRLNQTSIEYYSDTLSMSLLKTSHFNETDLLKLAYDMLCRIAEDYPYILK